MLIFEGLFPFLSPSKWRRVFLNMANLSDGQLRFFGLTAIFFGILLVIIQDLFFRT